MLAAPALAGENKFVFVPRADSPGNDYLRVENSSLEECERRCDAQIECNAFTYNQLDSVCFLKRSANRVTTFYVFAITGIRLSPSVRPTASDSGSGISFVILSQVDSEAPAFRTLSNKYPVENLAESLAEGIVSGHPDMPIFVFSPQDVAAIIDYLQSVQPSPQP
jgi:hypothetical protein